MRVKHPYALDDDAPSPDATVHWGGRREWSEVNDDGTFHVPDDRATQFVDEWPTANGYTLADLRVDAESGTADDDGTCAGTTAAGDPCSNPAGDDGYCRYHGPGDG